MANNGTILMIAFPEVPRSRSDHRQTMLKPRRQKYRQQKRRELRQQQATNNILSGTDPSTRRFHQDIINLKQDVIKIKKDTSTSRSFVDAFNNKPALSRPGSFDVPGYAQAYIRACLDDESEPGCFEEIMRDYEELNL